MKDEKEEIKPAPLGEQKPVNILTHLVDVCKQFEKSGESSEEQKPNFTQIANDKIAHIHRKRD